MAREIKIKITGDSSGLKSAFGDAEKHVEGFGSKVGSILGGIAKVGGALTLGGVAVAVPFLKGAVDAASDLNETFSKSKVIFGDAQADVANFARTAAKDLGQSEQQALDAASTFATFGKGAGLAGKDLAKFSTKLVGLSSDMASFSNTSPEEAIEAIGAALRGEAEPIRKYGILLDDATLRNRALKLGLISTTKEALTPANKVLAAQAEILAQTGDAQGDFERTSDGLANKQRILAARFADAKAEIGGVFLPIMEQVVGFLIDKGIPAFQKVADWVGRVANTVRESGWGAAFGKVVEDVAATVGSLAGRAWDWLSANLPGWLASFGTWFKDTAAPWLGERVADLAVVIGDLAVKGWEKLKENLPGWLANFAQWFENEGWPWLVNQVDVWANSFANWVLDAIPKLADNLVKWLNSLTQWFEADANPTAENGGEGIGTSVVKGFAKGLVAFQKQMTLWEEALALWFTKRFLPAVVKAGFEIEAALRLAILAGAKNFAEAWVDLGEDIIRGIIRGIKNMAGELAQVAKEVIWEGIPDVIRKRLQIGSPSKVMATIGGQIADGLAVGIANGASQVEASSQLLAQAAQVGDWPLLSGVKGSSPTITHGADGSVMFAGDPTVYPGSVIKTGVPGAAPTKVLPRPMGLGGDDPTGSYSLSTSGYGGGGGTYNITINGVIIGDRQQLGQYLKTVLDEYDRARL